MSFSLRFKHDSWHSNRKDSGRGVGSGLTMNRPPASNLEDHERHGIH